MTRGLVSLPGDTSALPSPGQVCAAVILSPRSGSVIIVSSCVRSLNVPAL